MSLWNGCAIHETFDCPPVTHPSYVTIHSSQRGPTQEKGLEVADVCVS